jgi:DNA-binding transcriptional ArsR family regulator
MAPQRVAGSERLDRAFHALADPTRRAIVDRLIRRSCSVSALAEPMGVSLQALGHHLRALERGGLIRSVKKGRVRSVSVNAKAVADVERWITSRRRNLERRLDRLQYFLATSKTGEAEE